jgi:hypothetical protein
LSIEQAFSPEHLKAVGDAELNAIMLPTTVARAQAVAAYDEWEWKQCVSEASVKCMLAECGFAGDDIGQCLRAMYDDRLLMFVQAVFKECQRSGTAIGAFLVEWKERSDRMPGLDNLGPPGSWLIKQRNLERQRKEWKAERERNKEGTTHEQHDADG